MGRMTLRKHTMRYTPDRLVGREELKICNKMKRSDMNKEKQIELTVIMAGQYEFSPGKKLDIRKSGEFYYVASNGKDFGLVKEVSEEGVEGIDRLPERFSGVVTDNMPNECLLKVRAKLKKCRR